MDHHPVAVLPTPARARFSTPDVSIERDRLTIAIERAVWRETCGAVRDLRVELGRNTVLLRGRCATYYIKQKAQHAAMALAGERGLTNRIEVD